ncbi:MAG: hypothetical protein RL758_107 [Pseudomonadota bacterium]|jgi:hypothetical protein
MALTTLAKLKQYGHVESFEDDTLLLRMIEAASANIETYCSRTFLSANYTEVRDGNGNRRMSVSNFPMTAVSSVTINDQPIPLRTTALGNGYTFDDITVKLSGYRFDEGMNNVVIAYTAGLVDVPQDVDLACCEMVMLRYKTLDRIGVSSKSLAGESITFTNDDFSDSVRRVLDQYKTLHLS